MIPRSSDPELRHPPLPALHATESLSSASGRSGGAVNPRIMSAFGAEPSRPPSCTEARSTVIRPPAVPDRLGRPALTRPTAGSRQWQAIAGALRSLKWTGRGNRKSAHARRLPRNFECQPRSRPAGRRTVGGIRPAMECRCRREVPCRRSSAPRNRAPRPRSAASRCLDARASLSAARARRRRRRPGASHRHAGPYVATRPRNVHRPRSAGAASAPGKVRSGYRSTGRNDHRSWRATGTKVA